MIVTHKLSMELTHMDNSLQLDAVQNDCGTRLLALSLLENGTAWTIPEAATVLVRYLRPDGTGGEYDTLADGGPAGTIDGNVLQVILRPELFLLPGVVHCNLVLLLKDTQLYSFPVRILVQPVASPMETTSDPAVTEYHLPGPTSATAGQYLIVAEVDDLGRVTAVTAGDFEALPNAEEATF